jgi:hypothetical protein
MEAKIKNSCLSQILAIFGNRCVTVIDHMVNICGYKGKEQRGWSYWIAGLFFVGSWSAFMGGIEVFGR